MSVDIIGYVNGVKNALAKAINDTKKDLQDHISSTDSLSPSYIQQINDTIDQTFQTFQTQLDTKLKADITARLDKERKMIENILSLKMQELVTKMVDKVVDYKLEDFEEKLDALIESKMHDFVQDKVSNNINDVIDSKMSTLVATITQDDVKKAPRREEVDKTKPKKKTTKKDGSQSGEDVAPTDPIAPSLPAQPDLPAPLT